MERGIDTRSLERNIDRNLERNLERSLRQESANAQSSFHSRTSTLLGTIDNHFEIPGGGAGVPLLDAHGYRQQAAMLAAQQGNESSLLSSFPATYTLLLHLLMSHRQSHPSTTPFPPPFPLHNPLFSRRRR